MSNYTRVYTPGGRVAHALDSLSSPNDARSEALCGRTSFPSTWHGTGSQDEIEKAADLKMCGQCQSLLRHRTRW